MVEPCGRRLNRLGLLADGDAGDAAVLLIDAEDAARGRRALENHIGGGTVQGRHGQTQRGGLAIDNGRGFAAEEQSAGG